MWNAYIYVNGKVRNLNPFFSIGRCDQSIKSNIKIQQYKHNN